MSSVSGMEEPAVAVAITPFESMTNSFLPPEVQKFADVFSIFMIILATKLLQPMLKEIKMFRGDRIIIVPIVFGLVIGTLVEFSTTEFNYPTWIRRILTDMFVPAGIVRFRKIMKSLTSGVDEEDSVMRSPEEHAARDIEEVINEKEEKN